MLSEMIYEPLLHRIEQLPALAPASLAPGGAVFRFILDLTAGDRGIWLALTCLFCLAALRIVRPR